MISVAYAGTRVIEIASASSAGVAGRFFADLGADVVRVEEVEKDPADPAERAVQTWARARKRVFAPRGRGELGVGDIDALLAGADVVITDLSPSRWVETFPPFEAVSLRPWPSTWSMVRKIGSASPQQTQREP